MATAEQMGPKLIQFFLSLSNNPYVLLLIINVALLILGWVMEPVPIILLTVPIFFPVLMRLGLDPIHLGVVMTLNLMIGLSPRSSDSMCSSRRPSRGPRSSRWRGRYSSSSRC